MATKTADRTWAEFVDCTKRHLGDGPIAKAVAMKIAILRRGPIATRYNKKPTAAEIAKACQAVMDDAAKILAQADALGF